MTKYGCSLVYLSRCCLDSVTFPPCDSQYYSHNAFTSIQEKIMSDHTENGYVIMGDMNTRFGKAVRDLAVMYNLPGIDISYLAIDGSYDW